MSGETRNDRGMTRARSAGHPFPLWTGRVPNARCVTQTRRIGLPFAGGRATLANFANFANFATVFVIDGLERAENFLAIPTPVLNGR